MFGGGGMLKRLKSRIHLLLRRLLTSRSHRQQMWRWHACASAARLHHRLLQRCERLGLVIAQHIRWLGRHERQQLRRRDACAEAAIARHSGLLSATAFGPNIAASQAMMASA